MTKGDPTFIYLSTCKRHVNSNESIIVASSSSVLSRNRQDYYGSGFDVREVRRGIRPKRVSNINMFICDIHNSLPTSLL